MSEPRAEAEDLVADDSPACNCGGAWHQESDHCVSWPCPGCETLCPRDSNGQVIPVVWEDDE